MKCIVVVMLFFGLFQEGNVARQDVLAYLKDIGFEKAFGKKYILILPLNQDYYVDNHWVQLMNMKENSYPDVGFVIVEKDTTIVSQIVNNPRICLGIDRGNAYSRVDFYTGRPIILELNSGEYSITNLDLAIAYQKKFEVFQSVRRN